MLGSWVACRLVFASALHGRFAFATEDKCRASRAVVGASVSGVDTMLGLQGVRAWLPII